jgi:hypothetical protein
MDLWSLFIFVMFVGSIVLAGEMARERGRSRRSWVWIAFIVGPLAPAILLVLGDRRDREANRA